MTAGLQINYITGLFIDDPCNNAISPGGYKNRYANNGTKMASITQSTHSLKQAFSLLDAVRVCILALRSGVQWLDLVCLNGPRMADNKIVLRFKGAALYLASTIRRISFVYMLGFTNARCLLYTIIIYTELSIATTCTTPGGGPERLK